MNENLKCVWGCFVDWSIILTLSVTIIIALGGYLFTYFSNMRLARRKDRLEIVNRQLREFYGPLFALVRVSGNAWAAFRDKYRPGVPFWGVSPSPTKEEAVAWRLWMSEVFMPLNRRMEKIIVENADLLEDTKIPDCLLTLCAHVSSYKPVLKQWELGDFSENTSVINFPSEEIIPYTESAYKRLKAEQEKLLGMLQ
ncbi:MAG: hypothetical protein ACYDG5_06575 [Dehalococcoidales bacterium]